MRKSSISSRQEKLQSVKAEDIFSKPLTKRQKETLHRLKDKPDSEISYADIPPLSEEQIAEFHRPKDKQLIAVRLDVDILEWLKAFGPGYSTRINGILRTVMNHEQAGSKSN